MTKNDTPAHLQFAGIEPRAHSLVAPVEGTPSDLFVLEHRRDGESLHVFLTIANPDGTSKPVTVSVAIPAALVRGLLDRVPEAAPASGT